jgi:uncharacterized repeat protein (TIGR01451 family)
MDFGGVTGADMRASARRARVLAIPNAFKLLFLCFLSSALYLCLGSRASADTLDWGTRATTNLLTTNDVATVNGVTVTTSGSISGTFSANSVQLQPAGSSNGHTGFVNSTMNASVDNESSSQTTTITFSEPVYNLSFTVIDIDGGPNYNDGTNAFNDIVQFNSNGGLPTGVPAALVNWNAATGRASSNANGNLTNTQGNITVTFAGPLTTVTIQHIAGAVQGTNNPTNQFVFIDDLTWTASPRVTISKISNGGTGTFSFTGTNGFTAHNITTATAGTAIAGPTRSLTSQGVATTLTEGAPPAGYALTGISCTGLGSGTATPNLIGRSVTLSAAAIVPGATIACTFSNTRATIEVQKITVGGIGNFSFSDTNISGTIANITTTAANTPTPATPTASNISNIGTAVTITEMPATGFALTSASCTDANGAVTGNTGAIGSLSGNTLAIPAANVVAGVDFTCVFTNTRATVKVQKTTLGAPGGAFSFSQTNLASAPAAITTTTVGTPTPASPAAINVNTIGTAVTITETLAAGYTLTSASCSDANRATTGNPATVGTLSGNTLTIPAANVRAGSDFTCIFTNTKTPTVKVQKTTLGGFGGPFAFSQTNLAGGPGNITTTIAATPTPVSPTAINVLTTGTAVTITETPAAGYSLSGASCTDANSAFTGNTGSIGSLSGATLTISAGNVTSGADYTCLFTNARLPTITITKISNGGIGPFTFNGDNGFGAAQTITTITPGIGASGATRTLAATSTATTITETIPAGYALTGVSCTGIGSGTATPNLSAGSVVLDAAATAPGNTIACTFTNTKLPTVTVTKISNGGAGAFSFSGTNGFANQSITTVSPGVGAAGATQTLTAASTATSITETSLASGFVLASISCSGLGSGGSATPNLTTATINLNAAATAPGANIACTFVNGMPSLTVAKTGTLNDGGDGIANAGDTITYNFAIRNTGTVTLTNISASDSGATLSGGPIASLAPGASDSTTITGTHTLTQAEIDSGSYANTVTITANPPTGPPVIANDTETVTLPSVPSFTVVKAQSAGPNPITSLPSTLTYIITVDNTGNRTLTAPVISDNLVQGANSLTLFSGPTLSSGDTDNDNALDTNETWVYTAIYAVTQANVDDGGNIVNTATFDSAQTSPVTSAPVSTPITQSPSLTIVKTADTAGPVAVNDVIIYTYTVTNSGNVTIGGVTVNDVHNGFGTPPAPGSEAILADQAPLGDSSDAAVNASWDVLAPGDSITFTAAYTVTQTDVDLLQ